MQIIGVIKVNPYCKDQYVDINQVIPYNCNSEKIDSSKSNEKELTYSAHRF